MTRTRPLRRVLFLVDEYVDPYGGTEGQIHALLGALPSHIRAEMWVLRGSDWLRENGFPCRTRNLGLRTLARPGTLMRLLALGRQVRRFDLLQTYMNDASVVGPLMGAVAGVPVVVSRRDLGFWQTPRLLEVLRRTGRLAWAALTNCSAVARHTVASEHVPPGSTFVVPNGHDPARFEVEPDMGLRERLGIPDTASLVGLLANVKALKRHDDFLAAIARLGEDVHALCIGDVVAAGLPLDERARRLGIEGRVHHVTALGNAIPLLKHLDVGVLCSETEGLSNAVLEYMACGLPVVATDVGGNPDLVTESWNGYLVPVGDVDALSDRIGRLVESPELARRMGDLSRRRFGQGYTLERTVERTRKVWRKVAYGAPPRTDDLSWEVIEDVASLHALAPAWNDLLQPNRFFVGPDWVLSWMERGEVEGRPYVLAARDEAGALVGLVPLVRRSDLLAFAGQGEGADHLDVVAAPDRARDVAHGALAVLLTLEWDRLRFLHLAEDGALRAAIRELRWRIPYRERLSTRCPYVSTAGRRSYAEYVAAHFSYASRRNIRRYPKRFRALEGAAVERVTTPEAAPDALARFFALHDARREDSGLDPEPIRAFHRALVERAARSGSLRMTFLTLKGRDVACEYAFRQGDKLYAFQSGLEASTPFESPGLVLQAILLEEDVFGGGLAEYDFLDGTEAYKLRWATDARRLYDVELRRPTLAGRASCLLHGSARLAYDLLKS